MNSNKTVFIKRDGSYYAIDFDSFKYDKKTDSYNFWLPLDKDNSISDSIGALDFKYITKLSLDDLEKVITFSDPYIVYELCSANFLGSFVVNTDGLTVDKAMLKQTVINIQNSEFNSDLLLFYSYLLKVLIENDIIKYKNINLPRFIIPVKPVLSSLTYLIMTYANTEDPKRLELYIETVDSLPDDQNPTLESLLTNDTEKMKYATEVIQSKVKIGSLSELEKETFIKCVNISLKYFCQPVIEYCAYARAKGNELFDRDIDLAINYFSRLIDELTEYSDSELFSEYCYEYANLLLEKSEDDKKLLVAAVEYYKMSALRNNTKAKIALYDIYIKKMSKSKPHVFLANQMLLDAAREGLESILVSDDVKQLPEAMIRKGMEFFYVACAADTEDEEAARLNNALENYLIGYRAQIEREKHNPDNNKISDMRIYFLKCIDDVYGDSDYDIKAPDATFTMHELYEMLAINRIANDVYFRFSIEDDGNGLVKGSIKMFRKSDNKPLRMCICIPQCWYCDFVTSFEFSEDVLDSMVINDDGICDFDVICGNNMYLDGEFKGSFDGTIKFVANDYIDFENEIEQLRKDPDIDEIFEGYAQLPSYLEMPIY